MRLNSSYFCIIDRSLLGKKFLGYPVRIDNKLYARNAFYFNFCFVFAPTTRTVVFEEIIRKISEYMVMDLHSTQTYSIDKVQHKINIRHFFLFIRHWQLSLELTTKLLSQCSDDTAQRTRLIKLLTQIRTDLNRRKMCMLQGELMLRNNLFCSFDCLTKRFVFKNAIFRRQYDHTAVHCAALQRSTDGAAIFGGRFEKRIWQLRRITMGFNHIAGMQPFKENIATTNQSVLWPFQFYSTQILPYINGFNHIARIASLADVALGLALQCIRHLILFGVVTVIPVFQYCNIYRPTPKLRQLATCKQLQQRCIEHCTKLNFRKNMPGPKAKVRDVFRIFASMAHGATFGELCVRFNPAQLNINERKMVLFGLLEGLIRRVDKYPITVQRNVFYDHEPIRSPIPSVSAAKQSINNYYNLGSQPLRDRTVSNANEKRYNGDDGSGADTSTNRFIFNTNDRMHQSTQSYHYYNGLKSFDEICVNRGISCQQLDAQLSKDRHVIVLLRWKCSPFFILC